MLHEVPKSGTARRQRDGLSSISELNTLIFVFFAYQAALIDVSMTLPFGSMTTLPKGPGSKRRH